ncbi:MAG: hypothetical protein H0X30_03575 [Anaerolineae bacterium]|nr:hypothetical protein [Anaerolineae bacterium]
MLQRIWASLGISALILIITTVGQVVMVPILLSRWGDQLYGEWVTLTNLVSGLSIINFGVQSYVLNILIGHHVRNEVEQGTQVLHAALRLYVVLCSIILLITLGLCLWPDLLNWLNIKALSSMESRLIVFIEGALAAYAILGGLLMTLLVATKQYPRRLRYSLMERLIFFVVPMIIAILGGLPLATVVASGALTAVLAFVQFRDVRIRSPFSLGLDGVRWRESAALIQPSLLFFAVTLASQVEDMGIILVISTSAGAQAVALFSTTLMLTNFVRTIINQGLNILWPEITAAANTEHGQLLRWHRLMLKLITGFALLATSGLILLGTSVLEIWTRGKIQVNAPLNILLTLYLLVHAPALVSRTFGLATNHQGAIFRADITTAVMEVLLALALFPRLGLFGAALALVAGQSFNTIWVMLMAAGWTSDSWMELIHSWGIRGFPTAIIVLILSTVGLSIIPSFAGRAGAFGLIALLGIGLGWQTWFSRTEREGIENIISSLAKRFKRSQVKGAT